MIGKMSSSWSAVKLPSPVNIISSLSVEAIVVFFRLASCSKSTQSTDHSMYIEGERERNGIFTCASIHVAPPCPLTPHAGRRDRSQSVVINFPASVSGLDVEQLKEIMFHDNAVNGEGNSVPTASKTVKQEKSMGISSANKFLRLPREEKLEDKRYDSFKTWQGKLDRQMSFRGKSREPNDISGPQDGELEALPALNRYFDALKGPELDTLRSSEKLVLPEEKQWPFLLRFPISTFGMCLGVGSQVMLWKTLARAPSTSFMNISPKVNLVLWCIAVALFGMVASIYAFKVIFYFEAVRREYYHPVRINFFFAPWIACLFLAIGLPQHVANSIHGSIWYAFMTPILLLELKIYGQWMSGGERRLSKVANPSNHLAVVGNFVGALLGASMGLKEGPIFFFAVGVAHYVVLFVTLYQRLPTNETLPKELHPVFFLFVAAPSVACVAWATISGEFGIGARIPYFIAMFLYASLVVRVNFFRGFRFSLAWWAYTFPMTGYAIATIRYANEVNNTSMKILAVSLSVISTLTVSVLLISTILHGLVFHDLFPNDIAIAISGKKLKSKTKRPQFRSPDTESAESSI